MIWSLLFVTSLLVSAAHEDSHAVRFPLPNEPYETIDLKQTIDPFSFESLSDCMKDTIEKDMPFILARAQTAHGQDGYTTEYYDAQALNKLLFNADRPHRYAQGDQTRFKSPLTNLPFVGLLHYAYWDDNQQVDGTYLGSDHDMHCDEEKKLLLHRFFLSNYHLLDSAGKQAVQEAMATDGATTHEHIAQGYYALAKEVKRIQPDDWRDVYHVLKYATEQTDDKPVQQESRVDLGRMYWKGKGVESTDQNRAFNLFFSVTKQQNAPVARARAQYYLGMLWQNGWHNGPNKYQDYMLAKSYYQEALREQRLPENLRMKAFFALGDMYHNGYGTKTDYKLAMQHYEPVAWQAAKLALRINAHFNLGLIHAHTFRDFEKAGEHFTIVKEQAESKTMKNQAVSQLRAMHMHQSFQGARVYAPYIPPTEASSSNGADKEEEHRDKRQRRN